MKPSPVLRDAVREFEKRFILEHLQRRGWNRTRTARDLGMSHRGLLYKIHRHKLIPPPSDEAITA